MVDIRGSLAGVALLITAFALPPAPMARANPAPSSGEALLARYRTAIEKLTPIPNVVFQYAQSRSGPTRAIEEEHRVYRRADGAERNETIGVNGSAAVPAIVHFSDKPVWPYDVRQFAVDPADYNVIPIGPAVVGGRRAYGFSTVRATPGDFAITAMYLDPVRALPLRVAFDVAGGGCSGQGTIDFGSAGGYWMPTAVQVRCSVAGGGGPFKESITFSDYSFPQSLPPDVFGPSPQP